MGAPKWAHCHKQHDRPAQAGFFCEVSMAQLFLGDNLEILRAMADGCVDSIVTDPPYGLRFMGKHRRMKHG